MVGLNFATFVLPPRCGIELKYLRVYVLQKPEVVKNNKTAAKKTPVAKSKPKEKSEAAKARDEARRKMLEERKRMMKQNKARNAANEEGGDMILIM